MGIRPPRPPGHIYELTHRSDVSSDLKFSRTEHISPDFNSVGKSVKIHPYGHFVSVIQNTRIVIVALYGKNLLLFFRVADDFHIIAVSSAGESSGILDKIRKALTFLKLIAHFTLHSALDRHNFLIRRDKHHITFLNGNVV